MVSIRAEMVRLHLTRAIRNGVIPDPIRLVSSRPAIGYADECSRFGVTSDPDGLLSRDDRELKRFKDTPQRARAIRR